MLLFKALLLILLIKFASGESTTYDIRITYNKINKYQCLTNSSFGMIWNRKDMIGSTLVSDFIPNKENSFNCNFKDSYCSSSWIKAPWGLSNSFRDQMSNVILDRRWEEFQTHTTNSVTGKSYLIFQSVTSLPNGDFIIPLSIRKKHEAHLFLCDNRNPPTSNCYWIIIDGWLGKPTKSAVRKCQKNQIREKNGEYPHRGECNVPKVEYNGPELLTDVEWRHFKIIKKDNNLSLYAVFVSREELILNYPDPEGDNFYDNENIYVILHGKENNGLWKIHELTYLRADEEHEQTLIGRPISAPEKKICLSFFVWLCPECSLSITFNDGDGYSNTKTIKSSVNNWEHKKIQLDTDSTYLHYLYFSAESNNNKQGYWLFDGPKLCSESGLRSVSIVPTKDEASCQILGPDHSIIQSNQNSCKFGTFSDYCIPCAYVDSYCQSAKFCEFNSTHMICSCVSGYRGANCQDVCATGSFGFECKGVCGLCLNGPADCDNVIGNCHNTYCRENFSGPRCDVPPNIIWNSAPEIISVGINDVKVKFLKDAGYLGPKDKNPKFYIFQVTKTDHIKWKDVSEKIPIDDDTELEINGLECYTDYYIRNIIFDNYDEAYVNSRISNNQFTTKCIEFQLNDVLTNITATSILVDLTGNAETCPKTLYQVKKKNKENVFKVPKNFTNLEPYTDYTFIVFRENLTEFEFMRRTSEDAPGVITNFNYKMTDNVGLLSWEEPKKKNGELRGYGIEYTLLSHKACGQQLKDTAQIKNVSSPSATLTDLKLYSEYQIIIYAYTTLKGEPFLQRFETEEADLITQAEILHVSEIDSTSTRTVVKFTPIECSLKSGPIFAQITLTCLEIWCEKEEFSANEAVDDTNSILLNGVLPYTSYNIIKLSTCRKADSKCVTIHETNLFKTAAIAPLKPQEFTIYAKNENHVYFRWKTAFPPTGNLSEYQVKYKYTYYNTYKFEIKLLPTTCKLWPHLQCAVIEGFDCANCHFNVKIRPKNDPNLWGPWTDELYTITVEEASEEPYDVKLTWTNENKLIVMWKHPNITNGILKQFKIITRRERHNGDTGEEYYNLNGVETYNLTYEHQIEKEILPATLYNIGILAISSTGIKGKIATMQDYSPPPIPILSNNPNLISNTNTTIRINIPKLTNSGQRYETYICILLNLTIMDPTSFDVLNGSSTLEVVKDSLQDVEKYTVAYHESITLTEDFQYTVGNDSIELQPGTQYNIVIFVITSYMNKTRYKRYDATGFTTGENIYLPAIVAEDKSNLFALFLLLPIAILIGGAYFVHKHREKPFTLFGIYLRSAKSESDEVFLRPDVLPLTCTLERSTAAAEVPNNRKSDVKTEMQLVKSDKKKYSKVVPIVELESYIKNAIHNGELMKQHALFPRGQTQPWNYGALKINKPKNRYNNLIAYDHTRVKLEKINGSEYSDYINANYIDGYKMPNVYIATQGPKTATLYDFWRMIWQENVSNIVMLANVYEGGKKKVEKYWPNINENMKFEDISITYLSSEVFANYEYRMFNVHRNGEQRKVEQLHFTTWPDHGVPMYCRSLVPFLQKILTIPNSSKSPIVLHCSAGVGRTGTVILCDICLRMASRESSIDMLGILEKLRSQRPNMVDNYEQYKLAHLVVLECLTGLQTAIPCNDDMEELVVQLIEADGIRKQLQYLKDTAWQDRAMLENIDQKSVGMDENRNRFQNIVPEPHSIIFISRYPVTEELSSYINAVEVDGFRAPGMYLVTQQPMPNTVGDFWRLVVEREVTVIVSLNEINPADQTCCQFWPMEHCPEMEPVDYLQLNYSGTTKLNCCDIYNIHLVNKKKKEDVKIVLVAMKNWLPQTEVPVSVEDFLTFWDEAESVSRGASQIIVTCYDGATASGLYVAMSFLIEKMKLEHECDVCQAVRNIRYNRKQFVESEAQYQFLLEASLKYINGFQHYANFSS